MKAIEVSTAEINLLRHAIQDALDSLGAKATNPYNPAEEQSEARTRAIKGLQHILTWLERKTAQ